MKHYWSFEGCGWFGKLLPTSHSHMHSNFIPATLRSLEQPGSIGADREQSRGTYSLYARQWRRGTLRLSGGSHIPGIEWDGHLRFLSWPESASLAGRQSLVFLCPVGNR
jgi:hypothetical protein